MTPSPARAVLPIEPGRMFFDTNILIYAQDRADPFKQLRAQETMDAAIKADRLVISTQVMQEFYAVAVRKRWMTPAQAHSLLVRLAEHNVVPASSDSVLRGVALQHREQLSIWDALVVQAALDARCSVLYSEDLQEGRRYDSAAAGGPELRVVNPFNSPTPMQGLAVHEAPAPYGAVAKQRRTGRLGKSAVLRA
jgi:predicted nucleic acid-binding protein